MYCHILVLTMEEEDIVVGLETVGSRSHDKEELPDSITTGGQVAGLMCPKTASMASKNFHSFTSTSFSSAVFNLPIIKP